MSRLSVEGTKFVNEILELWFGGVRKSNYSAESIKSASKLWFGVGVSKEDQLKFDKDIAMKYTGHTDIASKGGYDDLAKDSEGMLALCILCDQFTRNSYRGSKKAFELDGFIVDKVQKAIGLGLHKSMHPIERPFMFLPLMHSEDMEIHAIGTKVYQELVDEVVEQNQPDYIIGNAKFGLKFMATHTDIIKRFGRYPHRNAVMGRENTKEEEEYFNSKEFNSFGQ